jgi:ankyrin repeat protein
MKDTELFREVREGTLEVTAAEPDLSVLGEDGQSLLQEAIAFRQAEIARRLIEMHVPLDVQDTDGKTALHYAIIYGAPEIARLILDRGGGWRTVDRHGNDALWMAAISPRPDYELIRMLIRRGADPARANRVGRTVLDVVRNSANPELVAAVGTSA